MGGREACEEALQGVQAGSGPGSCMGSTTRQTPWDGGDFAFLK